MVKNNKYIVRLSYTPVYLISFALIACSSSDDSSLGGVNIPTEYVRINVANMQKVITESTDAEQDTDMPRSVIDNSNSVNTSLPASTAQAAASVVKNLSSRSNRDISILASNACPNGGTYSIPDTTTGIGDYIYDNCAFDEYTVNGGISITGTGDILNGTSFKGSYSYNELTISTSDQTYIFDGNMNIDYVENGDIIKGSYEIPSLTYIFGSNGVKISDYSLTYSQNAMERELDYSYTISSTLLGGSVQLKTTQVFRFFTAPESEHPYEGQLVITGAENTSARLTVEAGGTGLVTDYVVVEIDADGDGTYEDSRRMRWSAL